MHFCILQSIQKRVRTLKNFLKMKASKSCCKSLQIRLTFNSFGHFRDQRLLRANLRWYIIVFQGKAWFRMAPAKPKTFFHTFLWDKTLPYTSKSASKRVDRSVYILTLSHKNEGSWVWRGLPQIRICDVSRSALYLIKMK